MVGNRREEHGKNIITGLNYHNRVLLRFNYTRLLFNLLLDASIAQKRDCEVSGFSLIWAGEERVSPVKFI